MPAPWLFTKTKGYDTVLDQAAGGSGSGIGGAPAAARLERSQDEVCVCVCVCACVCVCVCVCVCLSAISWNGNFVHSNHNVMAGGQARGAGRAGVAAPEGITSGRHRDASSREEAPLP